MKFQSTFRLTIIVDALLVFLAVSAIRLSAQSKAPPELFSLCWVAYSPTNYNPGPDNLATPTDESIRLDLQVLHEAGFNGLVTYGASDFLSTSVPKIAEEVGFNGMVMGVWDPTSQAELDQAAAAASQRIVVGYSVGNEGLGPKYDLDALRNSIESLRSRTGKPVTTTEQIDDYTNNNDLLTVGDWLFPNAHPYFAGRLDAHSAAEWTEQVFEQLQDETTLPIVFKEVGLPTGGDSRGRLDESVQADYYRLLSQTSANFVYFEAFDQPWKTSLPIEPFWGLFKSDRTPKAAARYICGNSPAEPTPEPTVDSAAATARPGSGDIFRVYSEADAHDSHFTPSGYMGDVGDVSVNEAWRGGAYDGETAIQVTYAMRGGGPNTCGYSPCRWAGVYWQTPPGNWGTEPNAGYDLSAYTKVTFWARSDTGARVEFKVGGITGPYPDSLQPSKSTGYITLTDDWHQYELDLTGENLRYVIGGFLWDTSWEQNSTGQGGVSSQVFYLDDIQYER